jgi:NCS1 nucleoside transporter family
LPAVESFGVEPVPDELRTAGWRDLFAINFTFFLNPVMYVLGALAVEEGGLPLAWAIAAMVLGQLLAFACLVVVAEPGVDDGLPGQVAMRATFGYWGARILTSPYRLVASTYWFAAQALAGALGLQAVIQAMSGTHVSLVPIAIGLGLVQATLAVFGFDVMRYVLRIVLPLSLALTGVLLGLYFTSDDPSFAPSTVFHSSAQHLTWVGFATFVTVMCGSSLTLVTNIADFCRYTPTRRDMRIGFLASALSSAAVTTFVGGYAAVATGKTNPFVAVVDLTSSTPLLLLLFVAIVVQGTAANVGNLYMSGLSLVNSIPRFGRFRATLAVAATAVCLSALPDVVNRASTWITHLGNVAAPLTGVILADYLVARRRRLDVPALFDPAGRYRYLRGVNPAAFGAVALGVAVYYALPQTSVKVVWGIGVAAVAYQALRRVQERLAAPLAPTTPRSGQFAPRPNAESIRLRRS